MGPKRKAADLGETPPSNRRRTRSSGPLIEAQPVKPPPKKRAPRKPPGVPASEFTPVHASGSSKENDKAKSRSGKGGTPDDEMDLLGASPSKAADDNSDDELDVLRPSSAKANIARTTPRASPPTPSATKGTPRKRGQVIEVVITTPRSITRTPRNYNGFSAESPSPSKPPRNGKNAASSPRETRARKNHKLRSPSPQASDDDASTPSHTPPPPTPLISPSKQALAAKPLPRVLSPHLQPYLQSQKSAILQALQHPPLFEDETPTFSSVSDQLRELLDGTVHRNEGNSCLVLGPRGSGKSRLVNSVLSSLPSTSTASPVVVRLSAYCQINDRMAMREIARQVQQQIGANSSLPALPGSEEEPEQAVEMEDGRADVDLPPPSHLPTLISALPALGRPVVIVLDAFDGFAAHARQALLYCLLDTVQSCRGGAPAAPAEHGIVEPPVELAEGDNAESQTGEVEKLDKPETASREEIRGEHGILVVGMTSRVDCLTLLEKRVKSRFSHRVMRIKTLQSLDDYVKFARSVLSVDTECPGDADEEWKMLWAVSVEKFLADKDVYNVFKETFAFVKDIRMLCRLLISPIVALTPSSPWLTAARLLTSASTQRCPQRFPFLPTLPYPHIALLIAVAHTQASGHDTFTLEMLHDTFTTQVRVAAAAPVQLAGGAVGMVKVARGVMVGAFEHLVATRVFQPVAAPAAHVTREFVRYRCVADRGEIKAAVEHLGHTNLKKWFQKAQ